MTPEVPISSTPFPAEPTERTVNYCDVRGYSVRLATPEELIRPAQAIYSEQSGSESPRMVGKR